MVKRPMTGLLAALLCPVAALSETASFTDDILVTATRQPLDGANLPLAWSSIDDEVLRLTGQVHINEVMQRVAGAWISRGNGQESLTALRSPVLTGAGGCGPFYMAADGISLRAPGFCNVNQLFDANSEQASRIEVIKGPPTALYGTNAMHGVINILSAPPSEQSEQFGALEAGPWDYYRVRYGYGNTDGAHGLSVRFNGTTDGGYKEDSGYDQQKLTLRHDYAGDTWSIVSVLDGANLNQETSGFIRGYEAYKDADRKKENPNPEAYRDARSLRFYAAFSRDLSQRHRLTLTPYLRYNKMEFLQHFLPWQPVEKNGHNSIGGRITVHSNLDQLQLTSGIDLEYTSGWLDEVQDGPFSANQPEGVHYDYDVDASTAAVYSQAQWVLAEDWELNGGLRLEYNHYDYTNKTNDGPACGPDATNCRFYRPADRTDSFDNGAYNLGIARFIAEQHTLYARFAHGFRAPQTAELYRLQAGQEVADLDSEELDNLEIGLRGMLGDALAYDLSVYTMRKDNVIFQDADRQNISGAKTRHEGVEFSATWNFAENWYVRGDFNWAKHRYDSAINLIGSSGDIKGNDIDTAPRAFGSARLGSSFSWLESQAELEWVYMDEYYLEPDNNHLYGGHSLLNLRWRAQFNERLGGVLRVTNLTDEDYAERADFGFGSYRYFVGQPTGVYVELKYAIR